MYGRFLELQYLVESGESEAKLNHNDLLAIHSLISFLERGGVPQISAKGLLAGVFSPQ